MVNVSQMCARHPATVSVLDVFVHYRFDRRSVYWRKRMLAAGGKAFNIATGVKA